MRLQKYLAKCGVASRRKSEEVILAGRVAVNGQVVRELGTKVSENDKVMLDGKPIYIEEESIYILLNKPVGYVTTSDDQFGRATVLDLIEGVDERIYPVGRLDYDTSGLLILTNDGEFTYKMTHPKHEISKTYMATVKGIPNKTSLERFRNGLAIEDYVTSRAKVEILEKNRDDAKLEIVIHEGRNRQVRKMCEAIGHPVKSLQRVSFGRLTMGSLRAGKWRYLDKAEVDELLSL